MLDETLIEAQFKQATDTDLLTGLVNILRPKKSRDSQLATQQLDLLTSWLGEHPEECLQLRNAIINIIGQSDLQYIFSESGLITGSGFFAELGQKITEKFLPTLLPKNDLRIAVRQIFHKKNDYIWMQAILESAWFNFFKTVGIESSFENKQQQVQLIEAAEILSYRIAALSLDKHILINAAEILKPHNALVEQNKEWGRYSKLAKGQQLQEGEIHAFSHMLQWIGFGIRQIREIRRKKKEKGTSLHQTFITERIDQHLRRLQILLAIIDPNGKVNTQQYIRYFIEVVKNENTHNRVSAYFSQNFSYLAYQISEHSSHTGEKYITTNFKEYRQFFRSAAIGGFIISLAALVKMETGNFHLPYFWASFFYGLNYALAFVIIHFLRGSIATKQPALTASAIATALDNTNPKSPSLHNLAILIGKVIRSQFASLTGNLAVVIPMTPLIAWAVYKLFGYYIVKPEDIPLILHKVRPHIENIWYAAIAGVLLFMNGIVSGYFDNMVIYGKIPERLIKHEGYRKFFGQKRLDKIAIYIDKNLGAIMGNVMLGFGLGFMIFFGEILGLPLDIRHVTISSGFFGFAWFTSGFSLPWQTLAWCFTGLAMIAVTNLLVSFFLALYIALKSRQLSGRQLLPLAKLTSKYFFRYPLDFLLPPIRERKDFHLFPGSSRKKKKEDAMAE